MGAKPKSTSSGHVSTQQLPAGTFLFKEGDLGNTLFIVVGGKLELRQKKGDTEGRITVLLPGQIVGEKAILADRPYRRKHSVVAVEDSAVMVVDRHNLGEISATVPDFPLRILGAVIGRLDRANELNDILMTTDPAERLVHYLAYRCRYGAGHTSDGFLLELTIQDLEYTLHVERELLDLALEMLTKQKIVRQLDKRIFVTDEQALLNYLPTLREKLLEKRLSRLRKRVDAFRDE